MPAPPTPYENAYLGAFIFTMGVLARDRRPKDESFKVPTILQQTPHDKPLGDLLASWGARHFLLEFKRFERNVQYEISEKDRKWSQVQSWGMSNRPHSVQPVETPQAHFVAWGTGKRSPPDLFFMPYWAICEGPKQTGVRKSLADFISDLLDLFPGIGTSLEELNTYLAHLSSTDGSGGRPLDTIGGFLISVTKEGQVSLVRCDHQLDLRRSYGGVNPPTPPRHSPPSRGGRKK
jgi:hypothetical protein